MSRHYTEELLAGGFVGTIWKIVTGAGAGSLDFWVEILRGLVREMGSGGNNVLSKGTLRLMIRQL